MYDTGHLRLRAMMGTYPKTEPLKNGQLKSYAFDLAFSEIAVAQKGFKSVVRDLQYDIAELAVVTFLQGFAAGKPYLLLPFVMNGGFHHKSILCRAADDLRPDTLPGCRIGMRSYSQTTPTWVRGILSDEYGLGLDAVAWLSQEGAHVAEYQDPPWVRRVGSADTLEALLGDGEVDAIIAGGQLSGATEIRRLLPSPAEAAEAWYQRHKVVPINHMVVVRKELVQARPDVVKEIFGLLRTARNSAHTFTVNGIDLQPIGFEEVAPALEMIIRFSCEQGLIPHRYPIKSLFGDVLEAIR